MNYFLPNNLKSAFELLNSDVDFTIAAGCTDLYPITENISFDENILDISEIREIKGISFDKDFTVIGAATSWSDIVNSNLPESYDMLKECGKEVGSIQIQNSGTIGGNLCTASPAGDSIPCLLALDAKVELKSIKGARILPLDKFIKGARKTELKKGEILANILIPRIKDFGVSSFKKIGARKYLIISISMVACYLNSKKNIVESISISVGSCSEVAQRIPSIEKQLLNRKISHNILNYVDFSNLSELSPISDIRSSKEYRLIASKNLIKEVVLNSITKIKGF